MDDVTRLMKTEVKKISLQINANKTELKEYIISEKDLEENKELIFEN